MASILLITSTQTSIVLMNVKIFNFPHDSALLKHVSIPHSNGYESWWKQHSASSQFPWLGTYKYTPKRIPLSSSYHLQIEIFLTKCCSGDNLQFLLFNLVRVFLVYWNATNHDWESHKTIQWRRFPFKNELHHSRGKKCRNDDKPLQSC